MEEQTPIETILGPEAVHFGEPVVNVAIKIPSLAGGLRDALDVEPFVVREGERVFLIIEALPTGEDGYTPFVDKNAGEKRGERVSGPYTYWQKLDAGTIVRADEDLVASLIESMADRVRALRDEERGRAQIPGLGDGEPVEEHDVIAEAEEEIAAALAARAAEDEPEDDEAEFLADATAGAAQG